MRYLDREGVAEHVTKLISQIYYVYNYNKLKIVNRMKRKMRLLEAREGVGGHVPDSRDNGALSI